MDSFTVSDFKRNKKLIEAWNPEILKYRDRWKWNRAILDDLNCAANYNQISKTTVKEIWLKRLTP